MLCPNCGELLDETYDLGGVDYADELATIYSCEACGYRDVRGWVYTDAEDYSLIDMRQPYLVERPGCADEDAIPPNEPSDDIPF